MALIYLYESTETDFRYNGKPLPEAVVDVNWGLNNEFYATGRYPLDKDEVYKEIVEDRIVKVHTFHGMEPMRIVDVQDRNLYVEFEVWPLFFADMRNKMVKPLNLRNATGQAALNAFFNNLLIEPRFNFYSNITETHDYHTQDVDERENNPNQLYDALEVFSAIVRRWNGEISIRGYDIRMNDRIGTDTEALLYEKKNITEFLDGRNIKNIVTRAHGKAEWTEEGPDGEQVERSIQATVDSPLINAYSGIIFERQYTNNDVRSEKELRDWLRLKFLTENLDKPARSIEAGTNMINGTVGPADTLILKYIKHDVDMRIKIVGYEYDGFANKLKRFILGEPRATVTNTIGNTITETISNVVRPIAQTAIRAQQSADGKRTKYSGTQDPNTLNLNANKDDEYWRDIGDETIIYEFNGTTWDVIIDTSDTTRIADEVAQAQQDIAAERQRIDVVVDDVNTAVSDAGYLDLSGALTGIQQISQTAQSNAENALTHSLNAISDASTALSNSTDALSQVANIDVRVDDVEGTLELKADKQEVDTLSGIVDTHTLDIKANAEGLALKANQDTVDTLAGTVQSLGTEFDIVAGQVNSRVWNTDIETAIDGIEVGGRNWFARSNMPESAQNIVPGVGGFEYQLEPNTTYTASITEGTGNAPIYFYIPSVEAPNQYVTSVRTNRPRTITTDESGLVVVGWSANGGFSFNVLKNGEKNLTITKGGKATDWTPAPEDTLARFDHIETEWTQTFDTFSQTVAGIDGRVSKQEQTVSGMESVVYDPETGLSSLNTQLANLIQVAVTGEEMTGAISVLENNINARVEKGDVINQINLSTEGILLDADKVHIGSSTTIDDGIITNRMVAGDISADKITSGTLDAAKARIINLDFNTAVGNATEFVQSAWNSAAGGNVRITGSGILTTASDNSQTYVQDGIVGARNPSGATIGQLGYFYNNNSPWYTMQVSNGSHFQINMSRGAGNLNKQAFYIMAGGLESYLNTDRIYMNPAEFMTVQGTMNIQGDLHILGGRTVYGAYEYQLAYGGGIKALSSNSTVQINSSGGRVELRPSNQTVFMVDSAYGYMYRNLSMEGNDITNQSDLRLKHDIADTELNSLEAIKSWNFVDYYWNDPDKRGQQFGLIAQHTNVIRLYDEERDLWSINSSKQIMMNSHAIQQLALMENDTNALASENRTLIEELQEENNELKQRIEELESAA